MKKFRYLAEGSLIHILLFLFGILPLDAASALGGWIARHLGPFFPTSEIAEKNLSLVFPAWGVEKKRRFIRDMYENIGRTAAEYMHLHQIGRERVTVIGEDIFKSVMAHNKGGIFISAHLANWEINAPTLYERYGTLLNLTYRRPNNPYAARLLDRARTLNGKIRTFPKARTAARDMMQALKNKELVGILVDQKFNEGVAAEFFGFPAMTAPIFVKLAQKFRCPLIAVQNKRLKGAYFETIIYPPLQLFDEAGQDLPAEQVIAEVHTLLERWILENPEQWLWLHRRWPKNTV